MSQALGPQCCCGGPGMTRVTFIGFGGNYYPITFRFINPTEDSNDGGFTTNKWPCWAERPYTVALGSYTGEANPGVFRTATGWGSITPSNIMGYDEKKNWLIYSEGSFSDFPYTGYLQTAPNGGVMALDLYGCIGGVSPEIVLISSEDAYDILRNSIPGDDDDWMSFRHAYWNGASNGRLHGYSMYSNNDSDPEIHFKAWSVKYDGTDFTQTFHRQWLQSVSGTDGPYNMNVVDGRVQSINVAEHESGDPWTYEYRVDGALVYSADNLSILNYQAAGISDIHGQALCLGAISGELHILDGTDLGAGTKVRFLVLNDEDVEVEYYPGSIGYDPLTRATVVLWTNSLAEAEGFTWGYTTYIYKPVIAGNIIDQEGVFIYTNFTAGYGFGYVPDAPIYWGVVISGKLPSPLKVVAGHIPIPPPPVPDNSCSTIADCDETDLLFAHTYGTIAGLENCTIPDNAGDHPFIEEKFYDNLNREPEVFGEFFGYVLDSSLSFDPGDLHCITADKLKFYLPLGDLSADPFVDPGILWERDTYTASFRDTRYVVAMAMEYECSDDSVITTLGRIKIKGFHLLVHGWRMLWDGSGYNDLQLYITPSCTTFLSPDSLFDPDDPQLDNIIWPRGCNNTFRGDSATVRFGINTCGVMKPFSVGFGGL